MCGIVAIASQQPVAVELYDSLIHLQHRGQDAAGMVTDDNGKIHIKRDAGLVREIFNTNNLDQLSGRLGIAHVRYPTAGNHGMSEIQPLVTTTPYPLILAHNGNIVNQEALREEIGKKYSFQSSSDSEALLFLLADDLQHCSPQISDEGLFEEICKSIKKIYQKCQGGYSVIALLPGRGMIAFRDPHGIRPLVRGERDNDNGGKDYIFASEPTMFYALDFQQQQDIGAGEVMFVSSRSNQCYHKVIMANTHTPCVFEYVYFARPDAKLDEVSVYRSRLRMGQNLAKQWQENYPDCLPDIVIPAPFTANTAALSFAHELGVRYSEGLYKNPFIGRTFIMPTQKQRKKFVRYKLTPQRTEINKKNVLIVDDSIVRGTTSREIVRMIREHGAKSVYFASAAPPIISPCFYGINTPCKSELLAANKTIEEIRDYLGVDKLLYQKLDDLVEAVTRRGHHDIKTPCLACMNGCYITGDIDEEKMQAMEKIRDRKN